MTHKNKAGKGVVTLLPVLFLSYYISIRIKVMCIKKEFYIFKACFITWVTLEIGIIVSLSLIS